MMPGKFTHKRTGCILATTMAAVVLFHFGVQGVQRPVETSKPSRADRIDIDTLKSFGKLERGPVPFFHDRHTKALAKQQKDCQVCHLIDDNRQSLKFMRLKDEGKTAVMNIYHNGCISCHSDTKAAGLKSGPVTCGNCHQSDLGIASSWQPIGLDKSLHYRHVKSLDKKCEACHHKYDESQKKLVYAKGEEGTCRYCHQETTQEKRISMRLASHQACIDCHRQKQAAQKPAGPADCSGCHDAQQQLTIRVVENVPRMERNQPDIVFVKKQVPPPQTSVDGKETAGVERVPFNHKAHEQSNDTCRVCHHADLNACASCHTSRGAEEGKQIKLEQAMHQMDVQQSCVGCHQASQQKPACAGCHRSIADQRRLTEANCGVCHMSPPAGGAGDPATEADLNPIAVQLLNSREKVTGTYRSGDVPETVAIDSLSKEYEAVQLPHRKIVDALVKKIEGNTLANYFHANRGTLCQGCHHNSPASVKPPKCGSCHGQPFDDRKPSRPGLMAAYHRQCMDCHKTMGLPKPAETDCEACHKKK